ncbi:PIN domain-like protein [Peniophora sp. CONT]|nr:PIN domain-like protein [Peniophora sp. CONT]
MGVRGLVPFIQKTCPEVIKQIPERLKAFTGQTIVIDGTLITQRFHFANDPHPYRHVLGWYRLTNELREAGAHAICIFDGKERSAAKQGEIQRRREVRRVDAARGLIERNRLARFTALTRLLASARTSSDVNAFARAKQHLRTLLTRDDDPATSGPLTSVAPVFQAGDFSIDPDSILATGDPYASWGDISTDDLSEILHTPLPPSPVSAPSQVPDEQDWVQDVTSPTPSYELDEGELQSEGLSVVQSSDSWIDVPYPDEAQDVFSTLLNLFNEYRQSLSTLSILPAVDAHAADGEDKAAAVAMSRAQAAIAHEEGTFWRTLAFSPLPLAFPPPSRVKPELDSVSAPSSPVPDPDPDPTSPTSQLHLILSKSEVISASYLRRTHPPTETTYAQCTALLRAAGVPVITTRGATEAEALASALVRAGHGVAVASEDTDVLVHEAPLLRGITSRERPLTVIHGADLRTSLKLERDAFVDFALLLGTDFAPRIHGVGPVRARRLVSVHGSIESALHGDAKFTTSLAPSTPEVYLRRIRAARGIFATDRVELPPEEEMIQCEYDVEKVNKVMMEYGLQRYLAAGEWEGGKAALGGNFFGDNPVEGGGGGGGGGGSTWYGT